MTYKSFICDIIPEKMLDDWMMKMMMMMMMMISKTMPSVHMNLYHRHTVTLSYYYSPTLSLSLSPSLNRYFWSLFVV